jgi:uncharacterized protein (DUF1330 family)
VRGMPAKTYEAGMNQRVVVIEFETLAQATAYAHTRYKRILRLEPVVASTAAFNQRPATNL